jgi:hypothetical protein
MKKLLVVLFLLSSTYNLFSQTANFEGNIHYINKFTLPNGQDITSAVVAQLGEEQLYSVNANNYKSVLNGAAIKMQFYHSASNKYYIVTGTNELQEFDGAMVTDKITKTEILENRIDILGHSCKGIVMVGEAAKTTYYFDETLKVNPETYAKHSFGNWSDYMKASNGALPLKYIVESAEFIWEATATKIEAKALADTEFELPANAKKAN